MERGKPMTESDEGTGRINRRNVIALAAVATAGAAFVASQFSPSSEQENSSSDPSESAGGNEPASVVDSAAIIDEVTTIVGEDGFDVTVGSVRVFGPAGVAQTGTPLLVTTTTHPGEADDFTSPVGEYVHIRLGDGDQPEVPITINFDLSDSVDVTEVSPETPVVAFSTIAGLDTPLLMEGSFDPETGLFTIVTEHLSGFGARLADLNKAFLEFMWELMDLTFTEPACAYNAATVGDKTYSVPEIGNDHLWPCIISAQNKIRLELHSNSILSWQINSNPGTAYKQDSEFVSPYPALAKIYQAGYAAFGKDRYVLMPGSTAILTYNSGNPPKSIEMKLALGLQIFVNVIYVVHKTLERFLQFVGGELMPSVLNHFACFIDLVRSLNKLTDEGKWISLITTGLSCLKTKLEAEMPEMVEKLMKQGILKVGGKFAAKAICVSLIALISLLISAATSLTAAILGGLYTILDRDDFAFAIAESIDSRGDSTPQQPASSGNSIPMMDANAGRTREMPGPLPNMERPVENVWSALPDGNGISEPVVANGMLFAAFGGIVHELRCIDLSTGNTRWTKEFSVDFSNPIFAENMLFIGGSDTTLTAIEPNTGEVNWHTDVEVDYFTNCAAYHAETLFFPGRSHLLALNATNGETRWSANLSSSYSIEALVLGGEMVFATAFLELYALEAASGAVVWTAMNMFAQAFRNNTLYATSVVAGGAPGKSVFAFEPQTGEEKWHVVTELGLGELAVNDDCVFVTGNDYSQEIGGMLFAMDAMNGEEVWRFTHTSSVSSPSIVGNVVIVFGGSGGFEVGEVIALNVSTGEEKWRFSTPGRVHSPVFVDGLIILRGRYMTAFGNV